MKEEILPAYDRTEEIKSLFSEYTQMLMANDADFEQYLQIQNYAAELEHLNDKYGMPDGRLYLLCVNGKPAGCIGLRKIDHVACEMKRLYVTPAFRGHHFAEHLVVKIIEDAKEIGYQTILLDTLPFLQSAIHLYQKLGFFETAPYNDSPLERTIFMRLDLNRDRPDAEDFVRHEFERTGKPIQS